MSTADRSRSGSPSSDPFGQRAPGAAGGRDADRVEAGGDEEVPQLRRLAEDELVVRGEALRAVVEHLDPGLGEHRDPRDRAVHQDREVIPVLVEQLELERVGQRVGGDPGLGVGLEAADHQPADLLLDVGVAVRVAQHREVPVHPVDLLGDHVEVLGRVQRHGHPGHRADLLGPLAGAVDHHLGLDVAVVGADSCHGFTAPSAARMPVTLVRSRIVTPLSRAPRASAAVRSVGLARPSPGSQIAPARSSVRMIG